MLPTEPASREPDLMREVVVGMPQACHTPSWGEICE